MVLYVLNRLNFEMSKKKKNPSNCIESNRTVGITNKSYSSYSHDTVGQGFDVDDIYTNI